ncbi:hypothetical protein MAJ_08730, partial [Metarhizium majus ARSEF 297]
MELPHWYHRVSVTSDLENREVRGSDFDEDISELGEGEGDSEGSGSDVACECGSEDECECGNEDECECDPWEDDDEESEHSYTGSDADVYYDMKRQRIARKIRLRDEKELVPENPIVYPAYEAILKAQNERGCPDNEDRAEEARSEKIVYTAYEAMLKAQERGDCPMIKPIFNQLFALYSVDFHDYCSHEWFFRTPYVEFSALCWEEDYDILDPAETKAYGHIYLDSDSVSEFAAFWPPRRAGQLMIPLRYGPEECDPIIQFISDEYLIMTVRTDLDIVANRIRIRNPEATNIPDVFHFVGIRDSQCDKYDSDTFDSWSIGANKPQAGRNGE